MVYLGGWRHREGTDIEALLKEAPNTIRVQSKWGIQKPLGLNRPMNVLTMVNGPISSSNDLRSRDEMIADRKVITIMLMLLDYLEEKL